MRSRRFSKFNIYWDIPALANLQNSVNALVSPDQTNVRVTPLLAVTSAASRICTLVNASNETRTVQVEAINALGVIVAQETPTVAPGETRFGTVKVTGGPLYCRFTVLDGTRADIRGAIQNLSETEGSAVPAE